MDIGYLLSFLSGMCIAIVICDIISHKFFKRKRNKVHFYVARDRNGELCLYLGKPFRGRYAYRTKSDCVIHLNWLNIKKYGLNEHNYDNLKWEDEPIEVFLNMED